MSLAMLLHAMGHQAEARNSGADAILYVEENRPDAVLLDIGMPDMDELEACQERRKRKGITIIVLSG